MIVRKCVRQMKGWVGLLVSGEERDDSSSLVANKKTSKNHDSLVAQMNRLVGLCDKHVDFHILFIDMTAFWHN